MRVLMPIAHGSEEMEVVIVADVLRRASWKVTIAGIDGGVVRAARGVRLAPDADWATINPAAFDMLVIPGGYDGVMTMTRHARLLAAVRSFMDNNKWVAAICAGPLVLQAAGSLKGRRVTCHPGVAAALTQTAPLNERVVVDGRLVTSQGPGTAMEFALALVRAAEGAQQAAELARALVFAGR